MIKILSLVIGTILATLAIQNLVFQPKVNRIEAPKTAYERVIKSNTIRCAYALFPHFLNKDPNTGELSGVMYDLMSEFERHMGVKVSWGPEIDYANIALTLQSGKADVFCGGLAMTPSRGRVIAGSVPFSYSAMAAYVRADDTRFDNAAEKINNSDIKIAVNMGDFSEEISKRFFPKAELAYRGPIGGEDQLFLNVAMKKADITFSGPSNLSTFNQNNPLSKLRIVPFEQSIYNVPIVFGAEIHESALIHMINATLHDLIDNGVVDSILKKNIGAYYKTAFFPALPRI